MTQRSWTALSFLGVILGVLPGLAGCNSGSPNAEKPEEQHLPRVETVFPEKVLLSHHIELSAVIEPMEKADLCARVPGVIDSLQLDPKRPEIDIGRQVTANEALVKIAVPDLEAEKRYKDALLEQAQRQRDQVIELGKVAAKELQEAREQERRYQADLARAQEKHDRTLKLVQNGSLNRELAEESKNQLEAAHSAWQAARAAIETKQARVNASVADLKLSESKIAVADAEVKRLAVLLDYSVVKAPFDGVVTRRYLDRGAMVKDTATPIVAVMRTDMVRVLLDIPQKDAPWVNTTYQNPNSNGLGDPVVLKIPELRNTVQEGQFPGYITRMASALDPVTRTMRAEVHLENKATRPDGKIIHPLRPGMYGKADIVLQESRYLLTIPSTALVRRGERVYVYYIAEPKGEPLKGQVRRAQVDIGMDDGKRVEIRNGLRGDEMLIAKGNGVLRDGDAVLPVSQEATQ